MSETKSYWSIFDKKELQLKPPVNYLSFGDLRLLPEFRLALIREDIETFERILWENGLDITQGYNVKESNHRMRTSNQSYHGFRVDAKERTDEEWKRSGACSMEAFCYTEDSSLTQELLSLDPRAARRAGKGYNVFEDELTVSLPRHADIDEAGEDCV